MIVLANDSLIELDNEFINELFTKESGLSMVIKSHFSLNHEVGEHESSSDKQYTEGAFSYIVSGDQVIILGYFGNDEEVVIPQKITGHKVSRVREGAFIYTKVKKAKLYKDTLIDENAFEASVEIEYLDDTETPPSITPVIQEEGTEHQGDDITIIPQEPSTTVTAEITKDFYAEESGTDIFPDDISSTPVPVTLTPEVTVVVNKKQDKASSNSDVTYFIIGGVILILAVFCGIAMKLKGSKKE